MKNQRIFDWIRVLSIGLISGCATNSSPASTVADPDPDCSFRSPTTCWTVSGRFPERRQKAPVPPLERTRVPPPLVASAAPDSVSH